MKYGKIIFFIIGILFTIGIISIYSCQDEPDISEPAEGTITFKYTIPEKTFKYLEIEACWNNNEGTDMLHRPMLDTVFEVNYDIHKIPGTYPVVFVLHKTNRPVPDKLTDMMFDMEIKVDIKSGNHTIDEVYTNKYYIDDTHSRDAMEMYIGDQRNSTYGVKIDKDYNVKYIAPKQRPIIFPDEN